MEEEFKEWLKQEKELAPSTIINYTNRIKYKIPEKLVDVGFFDTKKSLYNSSMDELLSIKNMFNTNAHGLAEWNKTKTIGGEALSSLNYLIMYKKEKEKEKIIINKHSLNQILYGPPGTGKTYNTINRALEIIDGVIPEDREEAREKFNKYRDEGQIEFVTFHQSYGYEEFVEGIKADIESENIQYILEDGIFKRLSKKASTKSQSNFEEKIEELKKKIIDNGAFDIIYEKNTFNVDYRGGKTFRIKPKNSKNPETDYPASIENISKLYEGGNRSEVYNPTYTIGILEYLYKNGLIKYDEIIDSETKNYILIIDEINRGNISKIFGELITLIEPSKRLGEDEELKLTLPNSKDSFGVPSNLYIIGTMNTADRSITQIDTALRRRFVFEEMMPKPELIEDADKNPIVIDGIKVQEVLKAINERIEYIYDREHTIGHSYFFPLIKEPTKEKLDEIFKVNILPLLAEYFYGDWEDIIDVLNENGFIEKKSLNYKTKRDRGNTVYKINDEFSAEAYQTIYEK